MQSKVKIRALKGAALVTFILLIPAIISSAVTVYQIISNPPDEVISNCAHGEIDSMQEYKRAMDRYYKDHIENMELPVNNAKDYYNSAIYNFIDFINASEIALYEDLDDIDDDMNYNQQQLYEYAQDIHPEMSSVRSYFQYLKEELDVVDHYRETYLDFNTGMNIAKDVYNNANIKYIEAKAQYDTLITNLIIYAVCAVYAFIASYRALLKRIQA